MVRLGPRPTRFLAPHLSCASGPQLKSVSRGPAGACEATQSGNDECQFQSEKVATV